ncbi:hypothetical protein H632_c3661p0, partial [Helicosporidium sp. ATCC 50920]
ASISRWGGSGGLGADGPGVDWGEQWAGWSGETGAQGPAGEWAQGWEGQEGAQGPSSGLWDGSVGAYGPGWGEEFDDDVRGHASADDPVDLPSDGSVDLFAPEAPPGPDEDMMTADVFTFAELESAVEQASERQCVNACVIIYLRNSMVVPRTLQVTGSLSIQGACGDDGPPISEPSPEPAKESESRDKSKSPPFPPPPPQPRTVTPARSDRSCILSGGDKVQILRVTGAKTRAQVHDVRFESGFVGGTSQDNVYGGAVAVLNNARLDVSDCTFASNQASQGGALAAYAGSTLTVTKSNFYDNKAESVGGAISLGGSQAYVRWSQFTGNVAGQGGGAVSMDGYDTLWLLDPGFRDNSAGYGWGDDIYLRFGSLSKLYMNPLTA